MSSRGFLSHLSGSAATAPYRELAPAVGLRQLHAVTKGLLVAIGYYLGTRGGFALTPSNEPIATFWPPNAILLAAFLLVPKRQWWVLILAVLPAHLLVQMQSGVPLATQIGWFIGNTCEALVGAALISQFARTESLFESVRGLVIFLCFGVVLAPLLTSFLDAGVVVGTGWGRGYWVLLLTRLLSNMLAILTIVPTLVICWLNAGNFRRVPLSRWMEASALTAILVLVIFVVFGGTYQTGVGVPALIYVPLPLLLWAAVRFGSGGLSASLLLVSVISIWSAMHSSGPFVLPSMKENVLSLQVLLCTIAVPLMLLSGVMVERRIANRSLEEMSARLIKAQEEERYRIARELHDDAGQQLALAEMEIGQLETQQKGALNPLLTKLHHRVTEISRTVHEISHDLYPSALDNLGLGAALKKLCSDVNEEIPIGLSIEKLPNPLPRGISLCVYRVVQEALHNIVKHSFAHSAAVTVEVADQCLCFRVADDGIGAQAERESKTGLGLISMRERIKAVSGTIEIRFTPEAGTTIDARIPLP